MLGVREASRGEAQAGWGRAEGRFREGRLLRVKASFWKVVVVVVVVRIYSISSSNLNPQTKNE